MLNYSVAELRLKRCGWIVVTLPMLLYQEWKRKRFMQL